MLIVKRSFSKKSGFDFKHFITRGTILGVYRESLKLAISIKDRDMRDSMYEMFKDEFKPFINARKQNRLLS